VVWNPTGLPARVTLPLNLYFAGLSNAAIAVDGAGTEHRLGLNGRCRTQLQVEVGSRAVAWFEIRPAGG
jgi:hypothetical protein